MHVSAPRGVATRDVSEIAEVRRARRSRLDRDQVLRLVHRAVISAMRNACPL